MISQINFHYNYDTIYEFTDYLAKKENEEREKENKKQSEKKEEIGKKEPDKKIETNQKENNINIKKKNTNEH